MTLLVPTLEVQLECYEGPLAVLISLIRRNKVSIWEIPVSSITERFLQYVEIASDLHLKVAEDFIDMASLLIFIKSKMLLPSSNGNGDGDDSLGDDPREELVERIIEYERLKNMACAIDGLPMLERDVFAIGNGAVERESEYDLLGLCTLYFEIIDIKERPFISVRDIRPTLEEKLKVLKDILETSGRYEWDLFSDEDRNERVATVLGMLELTKIRAATLMQRRPFGKIVLKKRGSEMSTGLTWEDGEHRSDDVDTQNEEENFEAGGGYGSIYHSEGYGLEEGPVAIIDMTEN